MRGGWGVSTGKWWRLDVEVDARRLGRLDEVKDGAGSNVSVRRMTRDGLGVST